MGKVLGFLKKRWKYVLTAIIALIIGASGGPSQSDLDKANAKVDSLQKQVATKTESVDTLKKDNKDLQDKVDQAKPWFDLSAEQQATQKKEADAKAAALAKQEADKKAAEDKAAADKAAADAKAAADKAAADKAAADAKEKQGYNTGITYEQLARTPDNFKDQKVTFHGKVIQVIEGDGNTQIRLATNDNYDTVLFAQFDKSVVTSRILENDEITIMGTSTGLITYDSTLGGKISIPGVSIDKIEGK